LEHLQEITETIRIYEVASNAKANLNKSSLVPLNKSARNSILKNNQLNSLFEVIPEDGELTILGYSFDANFEVYKQVWTDLIEKLKKKVQQIGTRSLSLKGRVLTAGSLLASRIWYTSYIHPPSMKNADEIQTLLDNWTRSDSKSLPAAKTLQLPRAQGGWNLTTVKAS
jgi:hypothetical protein